VTKKTFSFLIISGLPIFAVGLETVISSAFKARVRRIEKAHDGLDLCATEKFDLVLLGVTQPEQSGLDLHDLRATEGIRFYHKTACL
jgi:DNA-binding NarL/FixJ family response regulator